MAAGGSRSGDSESDRSSAENVPNGRPEAQDLWEDVLRKTVSEGQSEDVSEAIRRARRDVPGASHDDLEVLTRFVMYFLRGRFRAFPLRDGALLAMSATLAQTLAEDPAAQRQLARLWPEFSES